jgi:hypothetical protein
MSPSDLEQAIKYLKAALSILEDASSKNPSRNPEWFRDTGHLSDKGIEHLNSLFAAGKTTYSASKEMRLSYRAVSLRHEEWLKKNKQAHWSRQDGR